MTSFIRLWSPLKRNTRHNEGSKDRSEEEAARKNEKFDDVADPGSETDKHNLREAIITLEEPDKDAQNGVKAAEFITLNWSCNTLILVFINIWFLYFVNAFQSSILSNLLPYVTSDFESHSLLNVIYVVADAITAAWFIPLSRILDVWGRAQGFLLMTVLATLGLILMATCHNLSTFCAAYVFYSMGFSGMTYCVDVITADSSRLRNRGLAYAFTSSPYIITAFAGPKAAEDALTGISWRWAFGIFAIILPLVASPLFFVLRQNLPKRQVVQQQSESSESRSAMHRIWQQAQELDLIGALLFSIGLVVFFLPFDIATEAPKGWASGYIIAMIVVGLLFLLIFGLYEAYLAPKPMTPRWMLRNRTLIGACLLDATYQVSYYCWANYFTSFLQVVNDLSVTTAGYVSNTFDVVGGVLLILVGLAIRRTCRFKWLLYIAVPLYVFAQGLMIYFRRPSQNVGYLVMCQVFISIGGSVFIIVEQLAVLAAVDHQHVAVALALLNVVGTVGDAMGATISGAIWTHTFYNALLKYLPQEALDNSIDDIYDNLDTQLSFEVGSPTRLAIQQAYAFAQTRMLTAGTCIMCLAFAWILLIKNIDVGKIKQVKGVVF